MVGAKSARRIAVLGATLIATSLPSALLAADVSSSTSGISGGDIQGISGGDAAGISGGDAAGISGGDAAGISGGDVLGISGGDGAGISGGDGAGISGGDGAGISGGDVFGISGGDAAGISGGDIYGISGGDIAGISGGDVFGISGGDILAGPVDSIDHVNGVFESMGQIVMASHQALASMRVGDLVSVQGSVVGPGWLYADEVSVSDSLYVPGATEVFVTGMLSSVDRVAGTAQVGALTIDYTPSLGSGAAPSALLWSFSGTRPVADGMMISDRSGELR